MRKPRDYDAELRALNGKAKLLNDRKVLQLGEVVVATGADQIPVEQLVGALLAAVELKDAVVMEGWRKRGAAFFHGAHKARSGSRRYGQRAQPADSGATSS